MWSQLWLATSNIHHINCSCAVFSHYWRRSYPPRAITTAEEVCCHPEVRFSAIFKSVFSNSDTDEPVDMSLLVVGYVWLCWLLVKHQSPWSINHQRHAGHCGRADDGQESKDAPSDLDVHQPANGLSIMDGYWWSNMDYLTMDHQLSFDDCSWTMKHGWLTMVGFSILTWKSSLLCSEWIIGWLLNIVKSNMLLDLWDRKSVV